MGKYSGESSIYQTINVFLKNNNTFLLQSFEKNLDNNSLNVDLVFDKEFNVIKFFIRELDIDIKDCLNKKHTEHYVNCFKSGESVLEQNLLIEFSVEGYFIPGKTCGPPENCYPDESDEERVVTGCFIELYEKELISLPNSCFDKIYNVFDEKINSVYFSNIEDDRDYDYPDYNDDYNDYPFSR